MIPNNNHSHIMENVLIFYIDNTTSLIFTWILFTCVCQIITVFGIITNIINIVCFVRQGFEDSTTISLLGLSVSDLASLITLYGICLFYTPGFVEADLPFESIHVLYLVFAMPHLAFTRVSSCITAMITVERCLSVVAPLKVKSIITPKRTGISLICIFIIFTFSATPVYIVNRLGEIFSTSRNKTIVGLVSSDDKEQVELFTFFINNFLIPFCSFVIISVCTVILTVQLHKSSKWGETTISYAQAQKMSIRNKKIAKMVVSISVLFICCFVPTAIIMLVAGFVPDISIDGKYFNVIKLFGGCCVTLEGINSSVNVFIYYHMSTKYRDAFRVMVIRRNKYTRSDN